MDAKQHPIRHARTEPVPVEALLTPDPELALVWAPLHDDAPGCRFEACASDEVCTCDE